MRRVSAFLLAFIFLLLVALLYVRPWYLGWGATDEERERPLASDAILSLTPGSDRPYSETRAITINAPAAAVWQRIAQLGQDRSGFYSFDALENLVGCEMPVDDRLRPDLQQWKIGDRLWMYPPAKAGGAGYAVLRVYVPGRVLGFATRRVGTTLDQPEDGSWSFELVPIDAMTTRLLVRGRGLPDRSLWGKAFDTSFFELAHFVMEKRMLLGVKDLAEGRTRRRVENDVLIATWFVAFITMLAAVIAGFRRARIAGAVGTFVAAGLILQILTLGQPPVWLSVVLSLVPLKLLWLSGVPRVRTASAR